MIYTDEKTKKEILCFLPYKFSQFLCEKDFKDLREIRFRCGQKTMLYYGNETITCGNNLTYNDISEILSGFCENSVYAYLNEIQNGFITLKGGHRVGICGECTVDNGIISNIHKVFGINIRIAKQFIGCSSSLMPHIKTGGKVSNTILIAPPACGKTTMLRDITRHLSNQMKITVIDERDEICAISGGTAQFDIGPQTDILSKAPKIQAISMALRSLSPDVIITDEVGTKNDISAIEQAIGAGTKIITSIHGYSAESIKESKGKLLSLFDVAIELKRENGVPIISRIVNTEDIKYD